MSIRAAVAGLACSVEEGCSRAVVATWAEFTNADGSKAVKRVRATCADHLMVLAKNAEHPPSGLTGFRLETGAEASLRDDESFVVKVPVDVVGHWGGHDRACRFYEQNIRLYVRGKDGRDALLRVQKLLQGLLDVEEDASCR